MENKMIMEEIIEKLDKEELVMYLGNGVCMETDTDKRILLFTHELKRSGAPSVLLDMSRVLLKWGYTIFLVSDEEGELLDEFVDAGVNVIIYPELVKDPQWFYKLAETFPVIFVNTMVLWNFVTFLAPVAGKIFWWIHESEISIKGWADKTKEIPNVPSLSILAASPQIRKNIKAYWNFDAKLLNFYVEDVPAKKRRAGEKIRILNVGDINGNKGQEVLADAFEMLDEETKEKCELYFCGENQRYNPKLMLRILDCATHNENVHMLEGRSKEELFSLYDEMDIVVVASNYESTSAIAVEGAMKEKICICTKSCGVMEYLKDGESAFSFERGDAKTLSRLLKKSILEYENLQDMRKAARMVYLRVYAKEVFEKRLAELLWENVEINPYMNLCSGCGACKDICPVKAISMKKNEKGFLYPVIDSQKCIQCRQCVITCPVNDITVNDKCCEAIAVKYQEDDKRMQSQSGGAFSILAEAVLKEGGVVYGAAIDDKGVVSYLRADDEKKLKKLKGSKYVQADLKDTYEKIREDMRHRKVLFSGTPCYVAGLKKFLQKEDTKNLLTCDLICHGVPSPEVYAQHRNYLKERYNKEITEFSFRDKKSHGWHTHVESVTFDDGLKVMENVYAKIFYSNACLRESCYHCAYSKQERVGDVTVGDFWGIEKVFPDMDDNKGVSLVLLNSDKGRNAWAEVMKTQKAECRVTDIQNCMQRNLQWPTARSTKAEEFWNDFLTCDYRKIAGKYGELFYDNANTAILNCWQEKLDKGEGISYAFGKNKICRVYVAGNEKNNRLAIMELQKGGIKVEGEIKLKGENLTGEVGAVYLNENLEHMLPGIDTILITDESNMAGILMELHKAGVPMEKITPISFLVDEEV